MDTHLAIASKRDTRSGRFRPRSDRLPDGGRLAGSARNRQPWRFVVVERRELVEQAAETLYAPTKRLRGGARRRARVQVEPQRRPAPQNMLAARNEGVAS